LKGTLYILIMTHTKKVKKIAQIANTFLHDCANVIWDMKEAKRVLAFHLDQFPLSMNFHYIINLQTFSILNQVVVMDLVTS